MTDMLFGTSTSKDSRLEWLLILSLMESLDTFFSNGIGNVLVKSLK
jgi:hypothetical protein